MFIKGAENFLSRSLRLCMGKIEIIKIKFFYVSFFTA